MTTYHSLVHALQTAGYRITPQRKAILSLLADNETHPSAQMIYEQLRPENETLSLATVYNTLDMLTRLGVINTLGEVGDRDAVRYDADITPHINLACIHCHQVIDIPNSLITQLANQVATESGYRLLGSRVLYYGVCPACQNAKQ